MKVLQANMPLDSSVLEEYKPGGKEADNRLSSILSSADYSRNETTARLCLEIMREYLCIVPAKVDASCVDPFDRVLYLPDICQMADALENHKYCWACNELSHLIEYGCTTDIGMRNAVLHILTEYLCEGTNFDADTIAKKV